MVPPSNLPPNLAKPHRASVKDLGSKLLTWPAIAFPRDATTPAINHKNGQLQPSEHKADWAPVQSSVGLYRLARLALHAVKRQPIPSLPQSAGMWLHRHVAQPALCCLQWWGHDFAPYLLTATCPATFFCLAKRFQAAVRPQKMQHNFTLV